MTQLRPYPCILYNIFCQIDNHEEELIASEHLMIVDQVLEEEEEELVDHLPMEVTVEE